MVRRQRQSIYPQLNDANALKDFVASGVTIKSFADSVGATPLAVRSALKRHGIARSRKSIVRHGLLHEKAILESFIESKKTFVDFANEVGCTRGAVVYALSKNELNRPSKRTFVSADVSDEYLAERLLIDTKTAVARDIGASTQALTSELKRRDILVKKKPKYHKIVEELERDHTLSYVEIGDSTGYSRNWVNTVAIMHGLNRRHNCSDEELELRNFLLELGVEHRTNDRNIIKPFELDFLIETRQLAIELDGVYWHSEGKHANKYNIRDKHKRCAEVGVRCLHIFDVEWQHKKQICKSIIANALGKVETRLHARKCTISTVSHAEAGAFLENNHIQGKIFSAVNLGLFFEGALVSLMTFSDARFGNKGASELVRFCSKLNTVVVGAAQKLFKHFVRSYQPTKIVSYADRRIFSGEVYHSLGFRLSRTNPPAYHYSKKGRKPLENRMKFQKKILARTLDVYDGSLTEFQNMLKAGYFRVWDAGVDVYVWEALDIP